MSDYAVRAAAPDEADVLGRLHVQVWREAYPGLLPQAFLDSLDPPEQAARWRERLSSTGAGVVVLVATWACEPVGFVSAGPPRDECSPAATELYALNVLADHHGTGLGDRLLDSALATAPAYLWVLAGNLRAQAFYRRHGFVPDEGRKRHQPTGAAEIRMVRR